VKGIAITLVYGANSQVSEAETARPMDVLAGVMAVEGAGARTIGLGAAAPSATTGDTVPRHAAAALPGRVAHTRNRQRPGAAVSQGGKHELWRS
jgi:hypothetical protein